MLGIMLALTLSAGQWKVENTTLEVVLGAEILMDVGQTNYMMSHWPESTECNPLLPLRPAKNQLYVAGAVALGLHAGIAYLLPRPYREVWQSVWIVLEGANIASNGYPGQLIGWHFAF